MESAKAVLDLIAYVTQMVKRIFEAIESFGKTYDARSLESFIEQQVKALGAVILETGWRLRMKDSKRPCSQPCSCGRRRHYVGPRPRTLTSVLGAIEMSERHYYQCDQCGEAGFFGDDLRGASDFSQLAEERIAIAGKDMSFQKAATNLSRLGVLTVAASTVRNVCSRVGARIRQTLDDEAARQHTPDAPKAEEHSENLAIAADGIMLGRVDPQHRRRKSQKTGRKVRNKAALKHFFHEVKTLVVFNFNQCGEALRKTFHATQERVEQFREKVSLEALKRGVEKAKKLAFLGDGAPWIWKTAHELFPNAVQILDWFHAVEHLWAAGRARYGSREKELWAWVKTLENHLWEGRLEPLIQALKENAKAMGTPNASLSDTAKAVDPRWIAYRTIGYFEENRERMNYPEYRAKGLPIGSGVVESGCKHVVADRLKRTGMRWDEPGAENILALRCHDLNGRWDGTWAARSA